MLENEKVTIVVPVYNYQNYVERCIRSLINQTYRNLEIIIVDDGSTDASGEICERLAQEDSRIRIRHQENGGIGKALETGLSMVTGDYVAFLDSDDYMELDAYEYLVSVAESTGADIVEYGTNTYDLEGKLIDKIVLKDEEIQGNEKIILNYFFKEKLPHLSSKFVKASLFNDFTFIKRSIAVDEMTTIKLLLETNKITKVSKCFYNCVRGKDSVSKGAVWGKRLKELFLSNSDILDFLMNKNAYCLSFYAIDILKKYSVMYYKVQYENFAQDCDVKDIRSVIKNKYLEAYDYVDWTIAKEYYHYTDIFGLKIFAKSPSLFCQIYNLKRKGKK